VPRKVLVLSASVGAGHLRAAQAVELALRETGPSAHVKNIDVLQLTNVAFRRVYSNAYLEIVNKAPHVLGIFYDLLNQRRTRSAGDELKSAVQRLNLSKLCEMLECERWDAIVNTHFLPTEIIAMLRRRRKIRTPQITVTTDFETHRAWVHQPCERYCTATEEGAAYLATFGVDRGTISVTGIPIHPVFSKPKDRDACLQRQDIRGDRPVVLQLAGGFGVGPIEKLCGAILTVNAPIDLIVVAGRNEKLRKQLARVRSPARHRIRVLGFTDQIDELMTIADIVVTKPGGLTSSEILARGAAMMIVNPIPGQESRNSDYLLENGAAIKANNLATLPLKLEKLLNDPQRLASLKSNARRIARPRAAYDVAQIALGLKPDLRR
jgi:processive 1,2-diacylglycerol beta-glucosyltransferase